jgi:hypothetical protein
MDWRKIKSQKSKFKILDSKWSYLVVQVDFGFLNFDF